MTSRPSTAAPILAVLAIMLVTLGAYVGGYLWLGKYADPGSEPIAVERRYAHYWQLQLFKPMATIESRSRRRLVQLTAQGHIWTAIPPSPIFTSDQSSTMPEGMSP